MRDHKSVLLRTVINLKRLLSELDNGLFILIGIKNIASFIFKYIYKKAEYTFSDSVLKEF